MVNKSRLNREIGEPWHSLSRTCHEFLRLLGILPFVVTNVNLSALESAASPTLWATFCAGWSVIGVKLRKKPSAGSVDSPGNHHYRSVWWSSFNNGRLCKALHVSSSSQWTSIGETLLIVIPLNSPPSEKKKVMHVCIWQSRIQLGSLNLLRKEKDSMCFIILRTTAWKNLYHL